MRIWPGAQWPKGAGMSEAEKTVVILSTKSAGSTALLNVICSVPGGSTVSWTSHQEHETLFWTKAASVLDRPQWSMPDSEVPLPSEAARHGLGLLARNNLAEDWPITDEASIGQLWDALADRAGPVFVEKSPHHLAQRSALELAVAASQRSRRRHVFVLLVRDPLAVLLSMWRRWAHRPERHEAVILRSFENACWLINEPRLEVQVVRYENLRADTAALLDLIGAGHPDALADLRDGQVTCEPHWSPGYTPSEELKDARSRLGYGLTPLPASSTAKRLLWPAGASCRTAYREARRWVGARRVARRAGSERGDRISSSLDGWVRDGDAEFPG